MAEQVENFKAAFEADEEMKAAAAAATAAKKRGKAAAELPKRVDARNVRQFLPPAARCWPFFEEQAQRIRVFYTTEEG
eukprot:8652804-Lingulodinium_polyedra.AAC.1